MFSLLQEAATTAVETTEGAIVIDDAATHGADAATHGVDAAGHAAEAAGLPQLDIATFGNQIFWLVVTLVVLYLVLSRVALPRIAAVLSDRQGAVTGDLMAAEEFKLKAREAEAAYDKALADARTEAQAIVARNRAEIQAQLDQAIAKADAEIAARTAESEARIRRCQRARGGTGCHRRTGPHLRRPGRRRHRGRSPGRAHERGRAMSRMIATLILFSAGPAMAASGDYGFFSLRNTDFIVLLSFLGFIGVLVYFKVPGLIGGLLDKRAEGIRNDLDEARRLREEAQEIYASYERRSREVKTQADQIVANAKREAEAQAATAREDLSRSIDRRLQAAQDQIASAENDAVRAVRDRAVAASIAAAAEILAGQVRAGQRSAGIDDAIEDVARRLN